MSPLRADAFCTDRRVQQARQLVLEALADHQRMITGIRPPLAEERLSYEHLLQSLKDCRGKPPFYPFIGSGFGRGSLVELADGSVKYDFITGVGCYLGHGLPELVEAAVAAALENVVLQGNMIQNRQAVQLMSRLIRLSGLDHCFLTTSGAMALENGLKIAYQAKPGRQRLLAFTNNFAGRTCTLAQVTDRPMLREGLPLNIGVDYLPYLDPEEEGVSIERTSARLQEHLERYPGKHAALIVEMVQGEGGCHVGSRRFFEPLFRRLREAGVLIIVDEIQTFGRTSAFFAYQHFGLQEYVDITTVGKLAQVCATLWRNEINPHPDLISQTFISSTSALHASAAVLDILERGYFGPDGKNMRLHALCRSRLERMAHVSGPFGMGTLVGFTPYAGESDRVIAFCRALFDAGVIGFPGGRRPTRVRFLLPSAAVTEEEIEAAFTIVEQTLAHF
jgi:acetylornithine/succinyldiaminopimelate/putrescine aminotransferase